MTWLWMVPSIIALLIKAGLLFRREVRVQPFLLLCIGSFFLLNLLELTGFYRLGFDLLVLKFYHGTAVFCFFYLASMSAVVSQSCRWLKQKVFSMLVSVFAAFVLFTDHVVLGVAPLANGSITRISGDYYVVFQVYSFGALCLALALLIRRLVMPNGYYLKARCTIALLSFLPSILVIFGVITLMQLGYRINMVGLLSLASCFMFLVFIPLSSEHALFRSMKYIPFTRERRHYLKVERIMVKISGAMRGEVIDLKALLKELEAQLIENTNIYFDSQKEAARILTISESSLSRKVDKNSTDA